MKPGDEKRQFFRRNLGLVGLALALGIGFTLLGTSILAEASVESGSLKEPLPTPTVSAEDEALSPEALLQLKVQSAAPDIPPPPGPVADKYGNVMSYGTFAPSEWISITTSTPITFGLTGDRFKAVNLGFDFPFYEYKYSSLYVYANGIIKFDPATLYQEPIPMDYPPNNFLAPFWVSLDVGFVNEGKLFTKVQGNAPNRTFIAEWFNVTPMGGVTQTLTFEVILHENGNIQFLYQDVNINGEYASVGIEDSDGVDGLQYMFHEPNSVTDGLKVNFARPVGAGDAFRAKILPFYRGKLLDNWQATYQLVVRNASMTKTDTFDLEYANQGAWQVTFFEADGRTLLRDTNGNTKVDTGTLTPSASKTILVRVKAPKTEPALSAKDIVIKAISAASLGTVDTTATLRAAVPVNFTTAFYNEVSSEAGVDLLWKNNDIVQMLVDAFDGGNLAFTRKPDKGYVYAWDNAQKPEEGSNKYKEIRFMILSQFGNIQRGVTDIDDHAIPYENIKDEQPAVAAVPDGKIGFAWLRTEGTNRNIFFAVRDATGNPVGTLQSVTGFTSAGTCSSPTIAATTNNKFIVAWVNDAVVDYKKIWYRIYDSNGNPLTGALELISGATVDYSSPSLARLSAGKALLAYTRKDAGGVETVKYRVYDGSSWLATEHSITSAEGYGPQAVMFLNGSVLLAWADLDYRGISYVAVTDPINHGPLTPSHLQTPTNRSLGNISLTVEPGGKVVMVWMDVLHLNYLYYAVVDPNGVVWTSPMTFMGEGANSKLVSSYVGLGIAPYDGAFRTQLPFLRK